MGLEIVQLQRHVGEEVVDRRLGNAVGEQLVAGEPNLLILVTALDDAAPQPQDVDQLDVGGDLEGFGGRRAQPCGLRSRCPS
ncbi:hypothetical protein [Mycobacterium haemophilum]|uniref:hypothetical protein n=1 Tax=Mycobacterium haemophilum TaxID=29311 RepID=UPI001F37A994|nr:hypothetical protein [Mycobacterium haemophilum]